MHRARPRAINKNGQQAKLITQRFLGAAPSIQWSKRSYGPTSIIAIDTAT